MGFFDSLFNPEKKQHQPSDVSIESVQKKIAENEQLPEKDRLPLEKLLTKMELRVLAQQHNADKAEFRSSHRSEREPHLDWKSVDDDSENDTPLEKEKTPYGETSDGREWMGFGGDKVNAKYDRIIAEQNKTDEERIDEVMQDLHGAHEDTNEYRWEQQEFGNDSFETYIDSELHGKPPHEIDKLIEEKIQTGEWIEVPEVEKGIKEKGHVRIPDSNNDEYISDKKERAVLARLKKVWKTTSGDSSPITVGKGHPGLRPAEYKGRLRKASDAINPAKINEFIDTENRVHTSNLLDDAIVQGDAKKEKEAEEKHTKELARRTKESEKHLTALAQEMAHSNVESTQERKDLEQLLHFERTQTHQENSDESNEADEIIRNYEEEEKHRTLTEDTNRVREYLEDDGVYGTDEDTEDRKNIEALLKKGHKYKGLPKIK